MRPGGNKGPKPKGKGNKGKANKGKGKQVRPACLRHDKPPTTLWV